MKADEYLDQLRWLTRKTSEMGSLGRQMLNNIDEVDKYHRSIGFRGMAEKNLVLKRERPEEYAALQDQYEDAVLESMKVLAELYSHINGIAAGFDETIAAKQTMEN